jgi:hypothetical protein
MSLNKPYKRTCRQLADGSYASNGNSSYIIHNDFAFDPQHYIRAYSIIQKDLIHLFEYIEPCDQNLDTISFRTHELLMRTCIEVEANFTAILKENIYSKEKHLNISDYKLINKTHRLSSYKIKLPVWKGEKNERTPFAEWNESPSLTWYQAYNKSKHDRHNNFNQATFDNLLNAVAGLVVILSSQFYNEDFSPNEKGLSIGQSYSYNGDDGFETGIGEYFRVYFPNDWAEEDRYSFNWHHELSQNVNPIDRINYDNLV